MIRPLLVGTALLLASAPVVAREPLPPLPSERSLPMHFEWRQEGPAEDCGTRCRTWISAIGAVTAETPRDFAVFAKDDPRVRGATMVLDSEGGSVLGALALGRAIRRLGMATTVGRSEKLPDTDGGERRSRLSFQAYCESMCAFVLLGGTRRYVAPESHVMVHQIWLGDRRNDAMAASYSAEDLVLVQRDIGRLAQYTVEMGASIDLLEKALRIPPWEPMKLVTLDEARQTALANADTPFVPDPPARTTAAPSGETPSALTASLEIGTAERGWTLLDAGAGRVLARRHPLTVEGQKVGQFDLVLACGNNRDTYAATYLETRKARSGARRSSRVATVALTIAGREVALTVDSSAMKRPRELSTLARAALPAAMVRALADLDGRSVSIATATRGGARTTIRVGNSGLGANLERFAEGCERTRPSRSTHAGL